MHLGQKCRRQGERLITFSWEAGQKRLHRESLQEWTGVCKVNKVSKAVNGTKVR